MCWRWSKRRQTRWAGRHKVALRRELGGKCALCGKGPKTRKLHFDVIVPVHPPDGHGKKLSWDQRIRYYKQHHERGNLRLLCATCNGRKGSTEDKPYHARCRQPGDEIEIPSSIPATVVTDDLPF